MYKEKTETTLFKLGTLENQDPRKKSFRGRGTHFCDTRYKGVGKQEFLSKRGKGSQIWS